MREDDGLPAVLDALEEEVSLGNSTALIGGAPASKGSVHDDITGEWLQHSGACPFGIYRLTLSPG